MHSLNQCRVDSGCANALKTPAQGLILLGPKLGDAGSPTSQSKVLFKVLDILMLPIS